jgi:hypothetical protein
MLMGHVFEPAHKRTISLNIMYFRTLFLLPGVLLALFQCLASLSEVVLELSELILEPGVLIFGGPS